jgi:hypothetical protein
MSRGPKLRKGLRPFYRAQSPTRLAKWESQSAGVSHIWPEVYVQPGNSIPGELHVIEGCLNGFWQNPIEDYLLAS